MRVTIAILRALDRMTGGEIESASTMAKELISLGHDAVLLTPGMPDRLPYRRDYSPFSWTDIKSPVNAAYFIRSVRRSRQCSDIVQCNYPTPAFSILSDIAGGIDVTNFGVPLLEDSRDLRSHMKGSFLRYLVRMSVNTARIARLSSFSSRSYTVATEFQKGQLLRIGVDRDLVHVIPNPLDMGKNTPVPREEARKAYGMGGGPVVGYLGHFHHNKGVTSLVNAFPKIKEALPDAEMHLAWSGSGRDAEVRRAIKGTGLRVNVTGKTEPSRFLSAIDVLVLPYNMIYGTHCYPHALLEAFSVGTPVVTSRLPVLDEMVSHRDTGMLTAPGDPEDIAEKTIELLKNRRLAGRISRNQRQAIKRFDSRKVARDYVDLYRSLH